MEAVIKQRMNLATDMLTCGNYSIQEVSTCAGYQSVCSFTRLFKKHVGMSPRQYRQENR